MNFAFSLVLAATAAASLQKALDSSTTWTMERTLAESGQTLSSTGEVHCTVGRGIKWQTLKPFPSSVEMTPDAMIFSDEDGRVEKPLSKIPLYADMRKATDDFAGGNTNAFDGIFKIAESPLPDGGWRLVLTPEISAMRRLFSSMELSGAEFPTNAVIRSGDGGTSTLRFKEPASVR